jgi:GxxExxY protein
MRTEYFSKSTLKHADLTEKIIGVFYDVYNELGHGFLESVYKRSLLVALRGEGLQVQSEIVIPVWFRQEKVGEFRADLVVNQQVLLELKAARVLDKAHKAQLLHYLKAMEIEIGLLLNFGERPEFRRLLFDNCRKGIRGNPCQSVAEVCE